MQKFVMLVGVVVLLLAVCGANTEDNLNHQAHINPQSPPLDLPQVPEFSPFSTPVSIPPSLFNSFPPSSLRSSDGSRRDVDVNQPPLSSSSVPDSSSSSLKKKEKKSSKKRQDRGSRPQLVDTRVIPLEATIASEQYGYLLNTFEFDQDVYVNQGFLCAGQDEECNPPPCVACDWSGPEPTDCSNPNCCGPAQFPAFPAYNHTNDWCDSSLPPYTRLELGVESETFVLKEGERQFFRFFISEEDACKSILVQPNIHYGDAYIYGSKLVAYPSDQSLAAVEYGQTFFAGGFFRAGEDYGAGSLAICPNKNEIFLQPGTYAFSMTSEVGIESTEFSMTIYIGDERYPIEPTDDKISCSDVPAEELAGPPIYSTSPADNGGTVCLEDGVTFDLVNPPQGGLWYDMVLPIQPGCQEITFSTFGFTDPSGTQNAAFTFFCGQSSAAAFGLNREAALAIKRKFYYNSLYISACFPETTYLHCSVFPFVASFGSIGSFIWSTEATPLRKRVTDVDPGQLTSDFGISLLGGLHPDMDYEPLSRWGFDGYSWITQPSFDPLPLYPPPIQFSYNYSIAPIHAYTDAVDTEIRSNIISMVDLTKRQNRELRDQQLLLEQGFVYMSGVTSATGMPVELCNDEDFDAGRCGRGSIPVNNDWMDFMTTRTYSSMNIQRNPSCDVSNYNQVLNLVQMVTSGEATTLSQIAPKAYLSDTYNSGLARTACVLEIESFLEIEADNITQLEKGYCPYEPLSVEWSNDPCCFDRLEALYCCAPQFVDQEEDLYTEADTKDIEDSCFHSDCDESFFSDIASSLNAIGNPLIGCASGLGDPGYELDVLTERALQGFYRPCLVEAGFGELFEGIECQLDSECEYLDSTCDIVTGKCRPGATEDMNNRFFDCFMENLPPKVEDYIRTQVLNPLDADLSADSRAFVAAVREAASQNDCVGIEGVGNTGIGERITTDTATFCKATGMGFTFSRFSEALVPLVLDTCPARECRGERTCLYTTAKMCGSEDTGFCKAPVRTYIPPSLDACPIDETVCSAEPPAPVVGDDCSGFTCALCLSDTAPCTIVEGITTEEDCNNVVACELPDGSFRYDLTADQCENVAGACTADCAGQSCRSLDGDGAGACGVAAVTGDCADSGGFYMPDGNCWLLWVQDQGTCDQMGFVLGGTPTWYTCSDMDVTTCSNHTAFDFQYLFLKCYVDEFRVCETREECEASGECSDKSPSRQIVPTDDYFSVSYGLCLTSGIAGGTLDPEPLCFGGFGEFAFPYGCVSRIMPDADSCAWWGSPFSPLAPHWTFWLTPATTEETCRSRTLGRFGCYLPREYEKNLFFWNETACDCKQGTSDYFFDWSPGIWRGGRVRSLTWMERETSPKYRWEETLSYVTMENWVSRAVENSFIYALKSQLVCETNYVTSSLSTLVCDCVGDGRSCFPDTIETEVGISGACADDTSTLKGPSSFANFEENSISELCTEANLFQIERSWFLFPRSTASVSFQFAERKERGVVLNKNKATVGEVMGDGSKIVFDHPERVDSFTLCLLITDPDEVDEVEEKYPRRDFGLPQGDYESILPQGLKEVEVRQVELYTYWCAEIEGDRLLEDGSVTYFPILRSEDFEDEEEDSLTHRTESLLYTLAACYIVDLILYIIFFFVVAQNVYTTGKDMPAVTWLAVIFTIVCIFRIVFCFVYIDDGFSDLSEYVVFEIPTFLLISAVILVICLFMRLSKKRGFDFKSQDKKLWLMGICALLMVWSLFIIVTVVYAEVILEQEEDSECPGRVKSSNDEIEDDTRTLSIIYQSIIIFFTLFFTLVFLRQAWILFKMTKKSQKAKVFVFRLGSVLVTAFLLRCILFLVLLSIDLTSDIYLFITLLLTEVIMMFLIALEVNKSFYARMYSTVATTGGSLGGTVRGGSNGSHISHGASRQSSVQSSHGS